MPTSLPLWMGSVPDYQVINGHMHIIMGKFSLAMPINVFLVGCAKGQAAVLKWDRQKQRDAQVVPIRPDLTGTAEH